MSRTALRPTTRPGHAAPSPRPYHEALGPSLCLLRAEPQSQFMLSLPCSPPFVPTAPSPCRATRASVPTVVGAPSLSFPALGVRVLALLPEPQHLPRLPSLAVQISSAPCSEPPAPSFATTRPWTLLCHGRASPLVPRRSRRPSSAAAAPHRRPRLPHLRVSSTLRLERRPCLKPTLLLRLHVCRCRLELPRLPQLSAGLTCPIRVPRPLSSPFHPLRRTTPRNRHGRPQL